MLASIKLVLVDALFTVFDLEFFRCFICSFSRLISSCRFSFFFFRFSSSFVPFHHLCVHCASINKTLIAIFSTRRRDNPLSERCAKHPSVYGCNDRPVNTNTCVYLLFLLLSLLVLLRRTFRLLYCVRNIVDIAVERVEKRRSVEVFFFFCLPSLLRFVAFFIARSFYSGAISSSIVQRHLASCTLVFVVDSKVRKQEIMKINNSIVAVFAFDSFSSTFFVVSCQRRKKKRRDTRMLQSTRDHCRFNHKIALLWNAFLLVLRSVHRIFD